MEKEYKLYISHSWTFNPEACKKKAEFFKKEGLKFSFQEAFEHEPKKTGNSVLTYESHIQAKMKNCDCVLMLAGANEEHHLWTMKELAFAKQIGKPVILIEPWQTSRTLPALRAQADVVVKWHGKMISDAIRAVG